MKRDYVTLICLIAFCAYFGIMITVSPAPVWLKVIVDIAFALITLGCLDAILAIRYNDREGQR